MKKGFSLFTPLIGTTVIVIAIMLSAVMIQNDVRISRAITSSFEQSNQEIAAKLIKASTEIQMLEGIEDSVESYFTSEEGTNAFTYQCNSESTCRDKIENDPLGIKNYIETDLQTEVYLKILSNIRDSTGYVAQDKDCFLPGGTIPSMRAEDCLAQAVIHGLDINLDISNGVYELEFNIDSDYENAFAVKFKSSADESIVISLAPKGLVYSTNAEKKEIVDTSVEIYTKLRNGVSGNSHSDNLLLYNSNSKIEKITLKNKSSGSNYKDREVKIEWVNGYTITLHSSSSNYNQNLCSLEIGTGNPKDPLLTDRCNHPSK